MSEFFASILTSLIASGLGIGVVVIGLSSWLGGVWSNRINRLESAELALRNLEEKATIDSEARKENAEMQKKIPSTMDRLLEKKNLELLETRNFNLRQENKELKEALEEERSFSDRLLEGIDRVLDMLERHLPKQLLHLVDKARDLLPEHQTYRQEKQHERGHSWGDMSL